MDTSAIYEACFKGMNSEVLEELALIHNPDIAFENGYTPISVSVYMGNLSLLKALISAGAKYNDKKLLHLAVERGHINIAEYLSTKYPILLSEKDEIGFLPVHCAAAQGLVGMLEILTRAGADINARDDDLKTPAHVAAELGRSELVDKIFELGGDRFAIDSVGKIPLDYFDK